jgi:phosphoesterase RecJ-like protein
MSKEEENFAELVENAQKILIIQADNPDGDSLGSAIALEQIFEAMNKPSYLFCAVNIPSHLRYLSGWSRVLDGLPSSFDLSIIVDTSSIGLLDKLSERDLGLLKSKPVIVLDHHKTDATIDFANLIINRPVVATCELIYDLSKSLGWELNDQAREALSVGILSDSLGLMSSATSPSSIRVIADLVEAGVNLADLDNKRRLTIRKSPELTKYKGELLGRIENYLDDKLAIIVISWPEIEKYSPIYNPSMLVIDDMRLIENNALAVAIKIYPNGKMTAKIRANYGFPVAGKLAEHFNGGGHIYASGFKVTDFDSVDDLKRDIIDTTSQLLEETNNQ